MLSTVSIGIVDCTVTHLLMMSCITHWRFGQASWIYAEDIYKTTSTVQVQERHQEHSAPENSIQLLHYYQTQ